MNALNVDLTALVLAHECRTLAFWARALERPLEERIDSAPAALIDFIQLDNIRQGVPQTPRAPQLSQELLADTRAALNELPLQVRRLLDRSFAGLYFVADFGGTGGAEQILDEASQPVAAFVVLDPSILETTTANAWATWRENTPFRNAPDYELRVEIEAGLTDNRKQAIQYILLHELGHVIATTHRVHPSWAIAPSQVHDTAAFPFFSDSWSIARNEGRYVSHFEAAFPQRRDVIYYREPKLSAAQLVTVYDALALTNFATLYAATSPFEDFAETFAMYVHVALLHRPFAAHIYHGGQLVRTFRPAFERLHWRPKLRVLEDILGAA